MASINGISLKAMKSFEGVEGTAWQGNVYVGTKKSRSGHRMVLVDQIGST